MNKIDFGLGKSSVLVQGCREICTVGKQDIFCNLRSYTAVAEYFSS